MNILSKIQKLNLTNDWTGKTVVVFGDSIVAGQELIREQTPYRDIVYAKIASQYLNARVLHNFAETGTGQFKGQQNLDRKTGWVHNFEQSIKRYQPEVKLADVVIIAYGNNDWKQPNPNGTMHSIEDVKQKLRDNIQRIRKINRNAKIMGVLETVAFRKYKLAWHSNGPNDFSYADMIDAYRSVYDEMDVAIFDMRDYHIGNSLLEYVDDRDHFTKQIHRLIAEAMVDFVKHGYKSPVDKEGQTTKIILEDGIVDLQLNMPNIEKQLKTLLKDEKLEFLFADVADNENILDDLCNEYPFLKQCNFVNMYDYFEMYYNNRAFIHPVANPVYNEKNTQTGEFSYMRQDISGTIALSTGDGLWYPGTTKQVQINNWLKQYLSTKDNIWSVQSQKLHKITIFDINNR